MAARVASGERSSTTRKLSIPVSPFCVVHKMVLFGTLMPFLAVMVRNWVSVRPQVTVGIFDMFVESGLRVEGYTDLHDFHCSLA